MNGATRPPFERMMFIARLLIRRKRFTAPEVAAEFEVSSKTVHRDLDFMRDRLGYEIEFDASALSYFGRPPRERIL